ncbi:hypothetical protein CKM354_001093600 [Cercospora kikuchii]|uniref:Uncharacterized protein n=1 Tax=Cercospora kikuchii TaxID=84275 RepID=A0A9P3CSJ4_9PEZI|nr:uncharacterized protein CKM354_001093600 [Cercospora kikuchii]GIZ47856.1 hypothetical protein CKM354_001093600 [Cercospora kikuchii]
MPSSSTYSTSQESLIIQHYKIIVARVWSVGYDKAAQTITDWYAELLEASPNALWTEARRDQKWWDDMSKYSNKVGKPRSDSAYAAGNLMADSAAVLFRFGRNVEAARFCEFADKVFDWAREEEEGEKGSRHWTVGS